MRLTFFICFSVLLISHLLHAQHQQINLLAGSYTRSGGSEGIYIYSLDLSTGETGLRSAFQSDNPSFLVISPDRKFVYAVNELRDGEGAVVAFSYDEDEGTLTFLNKMLTQGGGPCHITIDRSGRYLFVSNYSGGTLNVFSVGSDGYLTDLVQAIVYEGSGPNEKRQTKPYIHSAFFSPDGKRLFVQDLGTDHMYVYDFDAVNVEMPLSPSIHHAVRSTPGGGPRHAAVAANGEHIYLLQELSAQVLVYEYTGDSFVAIQEIDTNIDGFEGANSGADIKFSPDGKYLYATNRGDANTIAIYSVDESTGRLTKVSNQSVLGEGPRNFNISPDGRFLIVGNLYSNEAVIFHRDIESGLLRDSGHRMNIGSPSCFVF